MTSTRQNSGAHSEQIPGASSGGASSGGASSGGASSGMPLGNSIHPTAVVAPSVQLDGVTVGPFCVLTGDVRIGKGTVLHSHVVVEGDTVIGAGNQIFPFTTIGMMPQDLKYRGEPSRVRIGDRNLLREHVTVHRGTEGGSMQTTVGNQCLLMAGAHVAHDCDVRDHVILANSVALAGHVQVAEHAILGGLCAVHQFCRIGTRAFLSGGTLVGQDVPPFCIADGRRGSLVGINTEGLKRAGYDDTRLTALKRVYKEFFKPGRTHADALAELTAAQLGPDADVFLNFIKQSTRGFVRPRLQEGRED